MLSSSRDTLLACAAFATCLSTATADCYMDHDWNIFLNVGDQAKTGYYAAVKEDGTFTDLYNAQCLKFEDKSCVSCRELKVVEVGIPDTLACGWTFSLSQKRSEDPYVKFGSPQQEDAYHKSSEETSHKATEAINKWTPRSYEQWGEPPYTPEEIAYHEELQKIDEQTTKEINSASRRSEDDMDESASPLEQAFHADIKGDKKGPKHSNEWGRRSEDDMDESASPLEQAFHADTKGDKKGPMHSKEWGRRSETDAGAEWSKSAQEQRFHDRVNQLDEEFSKLVRRQVLPGMQSTTFDHAKIFSSMTCRTKA